MKPREMDIERQPQRYSIREEVLYWQKVMGDGFWSYKPTKDNLG